MNYPNRKIYEDVIKQITSLHQFLSNYDSLYFLHWKRPAWWPIVKHYLEEWVKEIRYLEEWRQEGIPVYATKDGEETDVFPSIRSIALHLWLKPKLVQRALKQWWKTWWYEFHYL